MKNPIYLIVLLFFLINVSCEKKKAESTAQEDEQSLAAEPNHQWTEKNKLEFERNCVGFLEREGVVEAKSYCDCLLEVSLEQYPDPAVASELEQNDIVDMFEKSKCLDDVLLIKLEDPWTEEVEGLFVEHCRMAQAEQGVGSEEAEAYCACALDQIKEIVPNPQHVISLTQEELDHVLEKCKP